MDKKKLTSLDDTKVYVDKYSKEIQEKAFEMGYAWRSQSKQEVLHKDAPFLFFSNEKEISFSRDIHMFFERKEMEVTAMEILAMDVSPVMHLQPFDKVLVRNEYHPLWTVDLYGYMDDNGDAICVGGKWSDCIPYEGYEYLLGTDKEWKKIADTN